MIIALIVAIVLVAIDQISKYLIVQNMALGESMTVIPGVLNFTYSHNDGMALGIGSESFRWIFVGVTVLVCGVLIYLMFRPDFKSKVYYASVVLIVSGGIGNLIDRVVNGYVVDFLALSFFPPICNFADYCVTAGTVLLVIFIVFYYGKNNKKVQESVEIVHDND
ncbi:MAG: signal peptidase II [Clostridia bacterium]|nr:signal peptidase II [Clostridia bacterium]